MFYVCCTLLYVHSSIAIILMGKRELIALLNLSSWCLVMVEPLFLAMPRGCLQFVIVVFPDHTHLLFLVWCGQDSYPQPSIRKQMLYQLSYWDGEYLNKKQGEATIFAPPKHVNNLKKGSFRDRLNLQNKKTADPGLLSLFMRTNGKCNNSHVS